MPLESCGVCHDDGSFASAPDYHAVTGVPTVSSVAFADAAGDLAVSFNLKFDNVAAVAPLTVDSAYIHTAADSTTTSLDLVASPVPVVAGAAAGDFTATISGGTALAGTAARIFLRMINADGERAVVAGDFPAPAFAAVVSDASCDNCHGPRGLAPHAAFGYPGMAPSECVTCHKDENGVWAPGGVPRFADSFVGIVHGVHNAHDYAPDGHYDYDGDIFDTTYPTYMTNCEVCHSEPAQLTAANSMPFSAACFTCHGSMESWRAYFQPDPDATPPLPDRTIHFSLTPTPETADCSSCHNPTGVASTKLVVTDAHNGLVTGNDGVIYGGVDTSVVEGEKFVWKITSMDDDGTNLTFTWEASYDTVPVDPCNETVGPGAPTFHLGEGGLRTYRSYSQGDDFIIGTSTDDPGQPTRVNLDAVNTTCTSLIATTVIPVEAVAAEKGRIALSGKPLVESADVADLIVEARVPSPTYDWMIGDGAATTRRGIVDTKLCLQCHVGSLYQHGGDRVDNVDYCLICHNAASNDKSVRVATMGIDVPADTYDGRSGQTFEMKSMLHRIHSAGTKDQPPLVIYRGRGVYAFAPDRSGLANWPGEGVQDVFGSTIGNVVNGVTQPPPYRIAHNFHAPTYPRALNDCAACHVAGSVDLQPDQTKAMASTDDAGGTTDWANQLDDVLQGATTTACVTCHAGGAAKGHAYQNGWEPQEFDEGRQTIIDAAN
jgi:OmcA/MtrC family decaheme c-type cytochrome